ANRACAAVSAASTAASSASGAPNMTFSRTLAENKVASSNAHPTAARSRATGMSRMSVPSTRIEPDVAQHRFGRPRVPERHVVEHQVTPGAGAGRAQGTHHAPFRLKVLGFI